MYLATWSLVQLTQGHVRTLPEHRYLCGVDVELIRVVLYAALFLSTAVAYVATAVEVRCADFFPAFFNLLRTGSARCGLRVALQYVAHATKEL